MRLESVLSRVLASLDKTTANINGVFSDENKEALRRTLADLSTLARTLAARKDTIDTAIADAGRTMHHAADASAQLRATLDRVGRSADSVNAAAEKMGRMGANADRTVTAVGADVKRLTTETLPQVENLLVELNALAASLRRLSDQTAADPSSLIRGTGPVPKGPGE